MDVSPQGPEGKPGPPAPSVVGAYLKTAHCGLTVLTTGSLLQAGLVRNGLDGLPGKLGMKVSQTYSE